MSSTDPSTTRSPAMPTESDGEKPAGRAADVVRVDESLGRIRRSMARRALGRRVLTELAVTIDPAVMEVIEAIERAGRGESDVAVGTVAGLIGVDPSQASRLVASAVKAGLVERVASQEDGRRSALRLTSTGASLLLSTRNHKRALLGAHFDGWSDRDLADFARLLERFSTIARGES